MIEQRYIFFDERYGWAFWDETGRPIGYFKRWEDARNFLMMYVLDRHALGDQDLLYVDRVKSVACSFRKGGSDG